MCIRKPKCEQMHQKLRICESFLTNKMTTNAMLIQYFNERAQVHCYNCSNLFLQVSAVFFFAGSFATRLVGTCVAKVISIRLRQSVRWQDKIAAVTDHVRDPL